MKKNGPYTITDSKIIYKNPWIEVREDKVIRPEGKEGTFGTVDYGEGLSVVALDKDKNIHLVREFCYVLEREEIQTPSGGIDGNETPLQAAQRELFEELGLKSDQWISLGITNALTMIVKHPSHLFLVTDAELKANTEEGIEPVTIPFSEAHQMVLDSKVYNC
jgi:8-oxo-dGTP pyrophosphatase MutT (NUDIX family)